MGLTFVDRPGEKRGVWAVARVQDGGRVGDPVKYPSEGVEVRPDDLCDFVSFEGSIDRHDIRPGEWGLIRLRAATFHGSD